MSFSVPLPLHMGVAYRYADAARQVSEVLQSLPVTLRVRI